MRFAAFEYEPEEYFMPQVLADPTLSLTEDYKAAYGTDANDPKRKNAITNLTGKKCKSCRYYYLQLVHKTCVLCFVAVQDIHDQASRCAVLGAVRKMIPGLRRIHAEFTGGGAEDAEVDFAQSSDAFYNVIDLLRDVGVKGEGYKAIRHCGQVRLGWTWRLDLRPWIQRAVSDIFPGMDESSLFIDPTGIVGS